MTQHQAQTTARYGSRYASSDAGSNRACLVCTSPLTGSRARFVPRRASNWPTACGVGSRHLATFQDSARIFSTDES
jgi:hypothetical protein